MTEWLLKFLMMNSNTACLKRQWKTAVKYSTTNHCTDKRDVILICLVISVFISRMLDSVTFFSSIKRNLQNTSKRLYYKVLGKISFHVMAEN